MVSQGARYDFNLLEFTEVCFLENVLYIFEHNVQSSFGIKCSKSQSGLMWHLRPLFPYQFSVWIIYPKSPTTVVLLLISAFTSINFCFTYLGAQTFTIVIASCIDPFLIV